MEPSAAGAQLPFDFGVEPAMGREDFLPAACNRAALDLLTAWPAWPTRALVLTGPPGAGKSHLARVWAAQSGAALLRAPELWPAAEPIARLPHQGHCVVDDADEVADEVVLFHLFNRAVERGFLLLTASAPVTGWGVGLPDLRSRLLAAGQVRIEAPDDALLGALLVKQLADRQLTLEPAVLAFLLTRLERSFRAVRALAAALDRTSLGTGRPITLRLARLVLETLQPEGEPD